MSKQNLPWYATTRDQWNRSGGFKIAEVGHYVISDSAQHDPEWDHLSNAYLIAAAPELLEALDGLVRCWETDIYLGYPVDRYYYAKAKAALAKAKGETE